MQLHNYNFEEVHNMHKVYVYAIAIV